MLWELQMNEYLYFGVRTFYLLTTIAASLIRIRRICASCIVEASGERPLLRACSGCDGIPARRPSLHRVLCVPAGWVL